MHSFKEFKLINWDTFNLFSTSLWRFLWIVVFYFCLFVKDAFPSGAISFYLHTKTHLLCMYIIKPQALSPVLSGRYLTSDFLSPVLFCLVLYTHIHTCDCLLTRVMHLGDTAQISSSCSAWTVMSLSLGFLAILLRTTPHLPVAYDFWFNYSM